MKILNCGIKLLSTKKLLIFRVPEICIITEWAVTIDINEKVTLSL